MSIPVKEKEEVVVCQQAKRADPPAILENGAGPKQLTLPLAGEVHFDR